MKKGSIGIVSLILILLLSGCQTHSDTESIQNTEVENIETHNIVDCTGRNVEVPVEIKQIATLYTVAGDIVTMLGEGEKIVGVTNGLKRNILHHEINPGILDAVTVKSSGDVNIESLAALNPSVVFIDLNMGSQESATSKLDQFGIPYLIVDFNSIESLQYCVTMIGETLGRELEAKEFNDYYSQVISDIKAVTDKIPEDERVRVYHSVNEVLRTDGAISIGMEWTEIAGCYNVAKEMNLDMDDDSYYTNVEQILLANPEVVLVNVSGVDAYVREQPMFETLTAVINEDVYLLPVGISRWGHSTSIETILAIAYTAKLLYPDLFVETDIKEMTQDYYRRFFDFTLSDDMYKQMMTGTDMRIDKDKTN